MNKPLAEWTLAEVKAECEKYAMCSPECRAYNDKLERAIACRARFAPSAWDLSEPPRWTEQEAELAKALYEVRRSVGLVIGRSTGGTLWWRDGGRGEGILPHKLFPSLNEGDCVRLNEIIGGGE